MYYLQEEHIHQGTPWRRFPIEPGLSPDDFPHSLPICIALPLEFVGYIESVSSFVSMNESEG
jgi:hypothetical protein